MIYPFTFGPDAASRYKVGPRGGVYTVDRDGTRHYLDRTTALRYIAWLRGDAPAACQLQAERSEACAATEAAAIAAFSVAVAAAVLLSSVLFGAAVDHPFWLICLTRQLISALF